MKIKAVIRQPSKVLKSNLNDGNLVQGVNAWVASLLRHWAVCMSWTK